MSSTISTAIGSSSALHAVPNNKSQGAALQGQINRTQGKLAAAGTSKVSSTPQGKADAAKLAAKVQDDRQKLQSANAPSRTSRAELNVASNDSATRNVSNLGDSLNIRRPTSETVGTRLDVYA